MSASSFPSGQKKFGLIQNKKKKKSAAPARRPVLSMFSSLEEDDDDEDEGDGGAINRANLELSRRAAACDMSLLEPPGGAAGSEDIYDYDGAYDEFKQDQLQKNQASSLLGSNKETALVGL
jgi:hypothetical protein